MVKDVIKKDNNLLYVVPYQHCKWHDHYLRCVPNTREDPTYIFAMCEFTTIKNGQVNGNVLNF
jgi:hypothetical protein